MAMLLCVVLIVSCFDLILMVYRGSKSQIVLQYSYFIGIPIIVGIPMGTNCAPLVADLFLYCYERDSRRGTININININENSHAQLTGRQ